MDFFEHQAKANRSSKYLIVGYTLALIVLTIGFNLGGLLVWAIATEPAELAKASESHSYSTILHHWLDTRYSWQVTVSVVLFVGMVSLANWLTLRQGGSKVAEMMGGRRIPANTMNRDERRLLNVVEEMALASGLPVPEVFIMDREHAINAFAAGYSPNEAAICVTRGLTISLNRDELQGVIGHEFSHILNGDMRLNVKMMSILSGLVAMGQLGRWLVDLGLRGGHDARGGIVFLALPGVLIWILGSLGVLCSRIIKAALSRQREFMADASAVQFTRQTQGIASALYKIHTHHHQSILTTRHAENLSHMCIAKTLSLRFSTWLDTHPPIEERITRLDAQFLTKAKIQRAQERQQTLQTSDAPAESSGSTSSSVTLSTATSPALSEVTSGLAADTRASADLYGIELQQEEMIEFTSPFQQANVDQAIASIGLSDQQSITAARSCLSSIPNELITGLHQPDYASLLLLLILAQNNSRPESATALLIEQESYPQSLIDHYLPMVHEMKERPVYPLLQLGLASLKSLSAEDKKALLVTAKKVIMSDKQILPQELFFYLVLFRHLNPKASRNPRVEFSSFSHLKPELSTLFGFLSQFTEEAHQLAAYQHAVQQFQIKETSLPNIKTISHQALANAIFRVEHLAPLLKRSVLMAVTDLMQHDDTMTHQELDWLRMLGDCWDCPIPMALGK
ncbi:M48 family metallopeptidase [Litoribrevibacter albus]|uniref:Peptidase M48 domain-containing protein n=1 Tax=Litoribrevibacter albus TaxID=1473156 RepID=A0AA37S5W5_9GAMM|nr:M48 family metallopeptidase [Litoribrevibacter albus]GLQ29745.1 hypothetical protein GCM10007876_02230 [Litoribrevibacter albus]